MENSDEQPLFRSHERKFPASKVVEKKDWSITDLEWLDEQFEATCRNDDGSIKQLEATRFLAHLGLLEGDTLIVRDESGMPWVYSTDTENLFDRDRLASEIFQLQEAAGRIVDEDET